MEVLQKLAEAEMPTKHGDFRAIVYKEMATDKEHVALLAGEISASPLVRVHSECLTGDAFGSVRCDCGPQLDEAMRRVSAESGLIIYLKQEGRGIGLGNKIKAYALQDTGLDTVDANHQLGFDADLRTYEVAAAMLQSLGINQIRLLTNNPAKIKGLEALGITVTERVAHVLPPTAQNRQYLDTKRNKMGHLLPGLNGIK